MVIWLTPLPLNSARGLWKAPSTWLLIPPPLKISRLLPKIDLLYVTAMSLGPALIFILSKQIQTIKNNNNHLNHFYSN